MTKYEFISKLKRALNWTFSQKEINEIISDYEGFFVQGEADGKSEQQICAELGDPAEIVSDLASELHKKRPSINFMLRTGLAAIILIYASLQSYNSWYDFFIIVTFAVVLWFALGGTLTRLPLVSYSDGKSYLRRILLCHGALLAFPIFLFASCYGIKVYMLEDTFNFSQRTGLFYAFIKKLLEHPYGLFEWVALAMYVLIAATLLMLVWSLYCFFRRSPQYFTVACHSIGVIAYVASIYSLFSTLDDPTHFFAWVLLRFVIYGASLALTALFALFIRALSRRA